MLRYYWALARRLPSIFRTMVEGWAFWVAMVLVVLGFLSPELAMAAQTELGSRWWALVPVGVLILWGILKANYEQFQRVEKLANERGGTSGAEYINAPPGMKPIGYYMFRLEKEEREELERYRAEEKLQNELAEESWLEVFIQNTQLGEWGPFTEQGSTEEKYWAKFWLFGVRLTNRLSQGVSLSFSFEVRYGEKKYQLAPHRCTKEEEEGLNCLPVPLNIPAKASAPIGSLAFLSASPPEAWSWNPGSGEPMPLYLLTITDHVSGRVMTVTRPTPI
jgi:hypothetical protein